MAMFMNLDDRRQKMYVNRRSTNSDNYRSLCWFTEDNLLTEHLLVDYNETRKGALNCERKMRTFLRYIGGPGFQIEPNDPASHLPELFEEEAQ